MFNIYVESSKGCGEYICAEIEDVHLIISMLEDSSKIKAYAVLDSGKQFNEKYLSNKKMVTYKELFGYMNND